MRPGLLVLLPAALAAGCGPGAPAAAPPTAAAASASPSPAPPAGARLFAIVTEGSQAVVRVHEQLAAESVDTDAVLTAQHAIGGALYLLPDATFWSGSRVTVDLRRLRSDAALRDKWIELFGPQTGRFPRAELVPQRAEGFPAPLPASGTFAFTLHGSLRIRETTKTVAWNATLTMDGAGARAAAKTVFTWTDFGIAKPLGIPQVVSVLDDIRVEVAFVAKEQR